MPLCHIRDIDQPEGDGHMGRATFAELPRPRDLISLHLPGPGRQLCEVEAIEHVGVHESTDPGATPDSANPFSALGLQPPPTEPATVLHVRIVQTDHTP